jgi:hypothetical protein
MGHHKKRRRRATARLPRRWPATPAITALVLGLAAIATWLWLHHQSDPEPGAPTAAIVDQLSLTFPNEDFRERAATTLQGAGFDTTYYAGGEATVDLYRRLPTLGYGVVVLRVHSDRMYGSWQGITLDETILFTSEEADRRYIDEQADHRLVGAQYNPEGTQFFGISSAFVEDSMIGDLDGALVILMGCEGLANDVGAQALIERGAGVVIGWDDAVSATHTDAATERLLELMLLDGLSAKRAVAQTMAELGPDPAFGANLRVYPD